MVRAMKRKIIKEKTRKKDGRKKMPDVYGRKVGQMPPTIYTGNYQSTPAKWEFDSFSTCY